MMNWKAENSLAQGWCRVKRVLGVPLAIAPNRGFDLWRIRAYTTGSQLKAPSRPRWANEPGTQPKVTFDEWWKEVDDGHSHSH